MKKVYVLFAAFGLVINFSDLSASVNMNSLNQELISFIKSKKPVKEIKRLIEIGADVNAVGTYGWTALMMAVVSGSKEVVELLLKAGAAVNIAERNGNTALKMAASLGSKEVVELLLQAGATVNVKDALMWAAVNSRSKEVIELLLQAADVNIVDEFGCTALMNAVSSGSKEIVELLLKAGADVNAVNNEGETALMNAVRFGSRSKEIVELLLQAGADVNAIDSYGKALLIVAADSGSKEIVELLLQAGANVNAALMNAVSLGSKKEVIELLLQVGANVNAVDNNGWTVLMWALVSSSKKEIIGLLLQVGANVNFVSIDGTTAIDLAGSLEIKQMLMRYKALRFIKINQSFDKEPKPEDYISDKAIMPAEATSLESTVAMIDEYDQEYGEQIEAFAKAHANWLRNQLQKAYEPFLYENNSERLLKFFENLQPSLLPEVATFFNSREDFLYVLNELKSHATGETLDRLQKIIAHEEHIAKDIAARKIQ